MLIDDDQEIIIFRMTVISRIFHEEESVTEAYLLFEKIIEENLSKKPQVWKSLTFWLQMAIMSDRNIFLYCW